MMMMNASKCLMSIKKKEKLKLWCHFGIFLSRINPVSLYHFHSMLVEIYKEMSRTFYCASYGTGPGTRFVVLQQNPATFTLHYVLFFFVFLSENWSVM